MKLHRICSYSGIPRRSTSNCYCTSRRIRGSWNDYDFSMLIRLGQHSQLPPVFLLYNRQNRVQNTAANSTLFVQFISRYGYYLLILFTCLTIMIGKRYNTLRRRLDDWNYDLDQLLLGAMLLTLINFLFPTVTVYYMIFALVRNF